MKILKAEAEARCRQALILAGAPAGVAGNVASSLVRNELAGHSSHGLLRLRDYLAEIKSGAIGVNELPVSRAVSEAVRVVDGRRAFGVLTATEIVDQLIDILRTNAIGAVSVINSHHLGRLFDIGEPVSRADAIVLGFVNYLGAGRRVAPPRGTTGKLCTNPVLIAIPTLREPFVLDMTTSTVAEGKIRQRAISGEQVPRDWLVDEQGRPVLDPTRLYTDPPTAFMTPLGGDFAYKGWALGVAVEVLAGILTGAGFVGQENPIGGNGGLFIAFRPSLFGRETANFKEEMELLRGYLEFRFPGKAPVPSEFVEVNTTTWNMVMKAAHNRL